MIINTKSITFSESTISADRAACSVDGLSNDLADIINNCQSITSYCRQTGFRQHILLSSAIQLLVTDPDVDVQLPLRLLSDLVNNLAKKNYHVISEIFGMDTAEFKKSVTAYLRTRASEQEGKTIRNTISFLRQTSEHNTKFDYQEQKYNNPLIETYAGLPSGLQKEIRASLEDDRGHLEALLHNYRDFHLFSTLGNFDKTIFLIHEYLDNNRSDKKTQKQVKVLLQDSFYPVTSSAYSAIKDIHAEQTILEKKFNSLKALRDYLLLRKKTPRTKDERAEWPQLSQNISRTALNSIYALFQTSLNRKTAAKFRSTTALPEIYNILKALTATIFSLTQYTPAVQNIIFYIEKEITMANSQDALKEKLLKYYKGLQETVQAMAQSRAA